MIYFYAFLIGGAFCGIAQVLMDKFKMPPAKILVSYVVAGGLLSLWGFYDDLINFAGAGASVPIIGFGHVLAQGAIKGAEVDGLFGALSGGLAACSAGVSAAILFGYLASILSKPREK